MALVRRHPVIVALLVLVAVFAGVGSLGMFFRADEPILELDSGALTTYQFASASTVQDIRPQHGHRGTNIDGMLRGGAALPLAIAGNPFESAWNGGPSGGIDLSMGTYEVWDVDLALPSAGMASWRIGRALNHRQETSGAAHRNSDGVQGANWSQISQPEIVLYEHPSDDELDVIYLIYGADRFAEFKRISDASSTFKGVNGAAGCFLYAAGAGSEPDTYTLTDQHGNETVFFGFDGDSSPAQGQLWKMTDPAGNVAYVGDATTGSTAISSGYNGSGYMTTAFDPADRRYTYTYAAVESIDRLTQVKAETKTGGTWASPTGVAEVGKVDYSYYVASDTHGEIGDLKLVTITMPLTDSGVSLVTKTYYRYYESDSWDTSSNPGYKHHLKMVVGPEGCRNYDWNGAGDSSLDDDFLTASDGTLTPYSAAVIEYDSSHRVRELLANGSCGCSGGGSGTHAYEYETNGSYTNNSGYDTTWAFRTIVQQPDGTYHTQYFDETHQELTSVLTDADPDNTDPAPSKWVTYVTRDSSGRVNAIHTPANVTGYTHSTGAVTTSTSAGLVWTFGRESTGPTTGYVLTRKWKEGTSGSEYFQNTWGYDDDVYVTVGDRNVYRPFVDTRKEYPTQTTTDTGANTWTYVTTVHSGELAVKEIVTTQPAVSTANHGPNTSVTTRQFFNTAEELVWEKSGTGVITYHAYAKGQETKTIRDADTTKTGAGQDFNGITIETNYQSTGTPQHHKYVTEYDAQGRRSTFTVPDSRTESWYYTNLADERLVTNHYPKDVPRWYSPADYVVSNHAGKPEVQGIIAYSGGWTTSALTNHIDETDSDPILAVAIGSLARLTTNHYTEDGTQLEESRLYFDIPASGAGSDGTNYDPTKYGYDAAGRQWRVKAAHGTINRTVYDALGRAKERWIGTNDSGFSGGESSGTDNMVKTEALVYDGGSAGGNSYLTQRTLYVQDNTTDQRVYAYTNDVKGNVLLETNPLAPHAFSKVDNLGRTVATSWHSSTANIVVGTDDPTTETSNRTALVQTFYDELGRAWKTQRHKIDVADGSDDDNLDESHWFDADGRLIKTQGSVLSKRTYDGLGRVTHEFTLASTNDSGYSDADDVAGDIVLQERQRVFEASSDEMLLTLSIDREHDDVGGGQNTGALDSGADSDRLLVTAANMKGRVQITGLWYDVLGRQVDRVGWGTHGDTDLDRDGMSVPSRSATNLRTTTTFNDDGTVQKVSDELDNVTYFEYDDAGRKVKEVRNYDVSVNSGNPSGTDDNVTTRWAYTDGLMVTLTADMPSGTSDQVTTYTYGVSKGGSTGDSKLAAGHLLYKTAYPDSTGDSDTVKLAYNAQGQVIWKRDQAGNEHTIDHDTAGRQTHLRWTTAAGGFDTAVRRISRTYLGTGQLQLVTSHDNATVGSGSVVNEVKYEYDSWGNISAYHEDRDSAVGANPDNKYSVSYTYAKATGGRKTVRRTQVTMPSGNVLDYEYESSSSHDDAASRVTRIEDGATILAKYEYLGMGQVVGTVYDEPDVFSRLHNGAGTYDGIDRFGRVTQNRWTKDLATDRDFYHVSIGYDWANNITTVEDNVHTGFDVKYDIDDVNRVTRADEGTLSSGSITNRTRDQQWTLDHVGNWEVEKLDLDGNGTFTGTGERNDDRSHNAANELTARDTDDNGTDNYTLTYDALGNLTDDGEAFEYGWDGFGRLRNVKDTGDQSLIAEYKYNGVGHLMAIHQDTDADGDVDANDKWFYRAYDERWRWIGTFRESDSAPKEEFVPHQAGGDGMGGSSYIDLVICRDKDANTAWTMASDGTLEERIYYCQNWRADVSAIVEDTGEMIEWVKYSAYGTPFGLPRGDTDSDGDADSSDRSTINNWVSGYDVTLDATLDGAINASDTALASDLSLGSIAASSRGSSLGLSGCSLSVSQYTIRHRWLNPLLGRWSARDPLAYSDGLTLYGYVSSSPVISRDPLGLNGIGKFVEKAIDTGAEYVDNVIDTGPISATFTFVWGGFAWGHNKLKFGSSKDGTPANAWQHCVWMCVTAKISGPDTALAAGFNHEENHFGSGDANYSEDAHSNMDMLNNIEGIMCAVKGQPCFKCCEDKMNSGQLYTLYSWTFTDENGNGVQDPGEPGAWAPVPGGPPGPGPSGPHTPGPGPLTPGLPPLPPFTGPGTKPVDPPLNEGHPYFPHKTGAPLNWWEMTFQGEAYWSKLLAKKMAE